jgi:ABC-type bacteriocin/lantibiotic exporter with double-glycine peptidase domain
VSPLIATTLSLSLAVPFVPQEKSTCGAASLAMVLRYWGSRTSHDEIAREVVRPELKGALGSRLAEFAQSRGFFAIAYEGDLQQLRDSLAKGRPVVVAWNLGKTPYHNVVVLGVDTAGRKLLVNDPELGPRRWVDEETFESRWAGADHWTLLVLPGPR